MRKGVLAFVGDFWSLWTELGFDAGFCGIWGVFLGLKARLRAENGA
jgi:hypothetical protein